MNCLQTIYSLCSTQHSLNSQYGIHYAAYEHIFRTVDTVCRILCILTRQHTTTYSLWSSSTCPGWSWLLRHLCSSAADGCWRRAPTALAGRWPWCPRRRSSRPPPRRSRRAWQTGRAWGTRTERWWRWHSAPACSRTAEERRREPAPRTHPGPPKHLRYKQNTLSAHRSSWMCVIGHYKNGFIFPPNLQLTEITKIYNFWKKLNKMLLGVYKILRF